MLESNVKRAVADFLQYQANLGNLVYMRLNAGSFILSNPDGSYPRRVQGVGKGTADYVVFEGAGVKGIYRVIIQSPTMPICRVTFLELKSSKGKTSPEQDEFAEKVKQQNCRYYVVRDAAELEEIFKL